MRRRFNLFLMWIVSGYCWVRLIGNTVFFTTLALIAGPFVGDKAWSVLFHRWARTAMTSGRFEVRVSGQENFSAPAVVAANHQSVFDIALLAAVLPPPVYFVAREDLLGFPFVGLVLRRGRHLIVPRAGATRSTAHRPILRQAAERLSEGGTVVFFPEGHRSKDGTVRPFKPGAFKVAAFSGCPLVPVSIAGTGRVIPKGSRRILPWRMAVEFHAPRHWTAAEAGSAERREQVREAIVRRVAELQPLTGPRLACCAEGDESPSTLKSNAV